MRASSIVFKFFWAGLILAGLFFFLPLAAQAASYYVDFTLGSESNAGTQAAPLKFHPWMASSTAGIILQAGDTVYMKRGEQWNSSSTITNWLTVASSGSVGNYITTTAYGTGAQPLIKIATSSAYSVIYGAGKSFIKFDNLHIQQATSTSAVGNGIFFEKDGSNNLPHDWIITNNEIDTLKIAVFGSGDSYNITVGDTSATQTATQSSYSNNIHNFNYGGVLLLGRNSVTGRSDFNVYYNYIHDSSQLTCGTDSYGIMFSANSGSTGWPAYATAKYNRVEGVKAWEGLDTHGGSYLYYQNNYVYDTAVSILAGGTNAAGLTDTSDHYYIENNIFENPPDQLCNSLGKSFIHVYSWGSSQKISNINIRNNKTFFTTKPTTAVNRSFITLNHVDTAEISGNELYNSTTSTAISALTINGSGAEFSNLTIKNNYFHDNYLRAMNFNLTGMVGAVSIYNNTVSSTWGIGLRYADVPKNLNIYNNVFSLTSQGGYNPTGILWEDGNGVAAGALVNIKNNIFMANPAGGSYYIWAPSSTIASPAALFNNSLFVDNNLYYNSSVSSPFYVGNTTQNWAAWQALGYDASGLGANTNPLLTNTTGNYSAAADFVPLWNSPVVDAGTTASSTTDYAGNNLYGTTDIGPYEYQPPYTIGTDNINTSGTVRLYVDGKFRNTDTPTSTTAGLFVTPVGGFGSGTYTAWMDIKINTWNTTSTMFRKWTESNTSAVSTSHTVSNLSASKYYTVWYTKTGGSKTRLTAVQTNAAGQATFTYDQGYSTVIFEIIEDVTAPAAFTLASPVTGSLLSNSNSQFTFSWNASADAESGLAKYQLYIDDALAVDNISSNSTSVANTTALTGGSHSWYVKAVDYAGNATQSTNTLTFTYNIYVGGGPGISVSPAPVNPAATIPAGPVRQPATSVPAASASQSGSIATPPVVIQGLPANYKFTSILRYGQYSKNVRYLQIFLKAQGQDIYPANAPITGWFGPTTRQAVIRFQEKYAAEILAPNKLKKGTGIVAKTTFQKINKLMGK